MNNTIELIVKGKDYTPISQSDFRIICDGQEIIHICLDGHNQIEEQVVDNITEEIGVVRDHLVDITSKFLDAEQRKVKDRIITYNYAEGAGKKRDKTLSQSFSGEEYYGGIVGIINDDFEYDFIQDNQSLKEISIVKLRIRLQIQTRFDEVKPLFLATMLLRDDINLDDNMVPADEDELYDYLLLFWYKSMLQEAYLKGFYRTYRRFENNDDRLKGSIDIARHIKMNAGQGNGKIAYSYRENTVNNFLNHMIILAYEHLKRKFPALMESNFDNNPDMKKIIESLRYEIGYNAVDSRTLIAKNNKPISHPYYVEYENLRKICIMILRDEALTIWDAEDVDTKTILFYVPDLWELFLADKLKEKLKDIYVEAQDQVMIFGDVDRNEKSYIQKTYPDFVFYEAKDGEQKVNPFMILDAKFKKGWESSLVEGDKGKSKISDLNDYDKCIRDMNSLDVHATGIIYPTTKKTTDDTYFDDKSITHSISVMNSKDNFYTFPVSIPKVEFEKTPYVDWRIKFDANVEMALEAIQDKSIKEKYYAERMRNALKYVRRV